MRGSDLDQVVFAMYFSGVVSMRCHPGYQKDVPVNWTLQDELDKCAYIADSMFGRHVARFGRK